MPQQLKNSPKEIYKRRLHYKRNYNEIEKSFDILLNYLLHSIKINNQDEIKTNTRLLLFLLGAYAETFLLSFINDTGLGQKPYFSNKEIEDILALGTQEQKWEQTIKFSMEIKLLKKYHALSRTDSIIFDDLVKTFNSHISPTIRLRNKMAHGQFVHIIDGESGLEQSLNKENYLSLKHKKKILKQLINCLTSVISSENTIADDYNSFYKKIESILIELENDNFEEWKTLQQSKFQEGLIRKKQNELKKL